MQDRIYAVLKETKNSQPPSPARLEGTTTPRASAATAGQRRKWYALILAAAVLIAGGLLRVPAIQSLFGDVAASLPWLQRPVVVLYFTDPEATLFVPVSRPIASEEGLPRVALEELIRGPRPDAGLGAPLPAGAQINNFAVRAGVAYVDLAQNSLGELRGDGLAVAAAAIYRTLTQLPEIEDVVITVDGRAVAGAQGDALIPAQAGVAPLYYVYGDYLVPFWPARAAAMGPRAVLAAYLEGPPPGSGLAGLPPGTRLLGLDFNGENGLVKVNLSYTDAVRALAVADPDRMRLVLLSLIYTLAEQPGVKAVMLDFEGRSQLGLGQCASLLRTPQLRPAVLNDERLIR